ncbi:MAG TPA: TIGR00725 family protein [Thermoleophilaceae bacterium]|nr:TIGR00725 family protein [Thermoleophilaceae bacterium]
MADYVAVIGASAPRPEDLEHAHAAGRRLAELGAIVVTGGRGGVMEAACRGAKEGGGMTVGILPGLDRSDANAFVDVSLPTGLGEMRNGLVARAAEAVVAVGGAWGTLAEIAFARGAGTPVFGVGSWELGDDGVTVVGSGAEAAERAVAAIRS